MCTSVFSIAVINPAVFDQWKQYSLQYDKAKIHPQKSNVLMILELGIFPLNM